jgi:hypothetical protein
MHKKLMPCSLLKLAGNDRETRHHYTVGGVRQSVATLADLYTPRTGATTSRQDRGVGRG